MAHPILGQIRAVAESWRDEAKRRRQVSGTDPVADTFDYTAGELSAVLDELALAKSSYTVAEFAALQHPPVTPQAIRKWIADGELTAERGADGHWQIPIGATRRRHTSSTTDTTTTVTQRSA